MHSLIFDAERRNLEESRGVDALDPASNNVNLAARA
jgi:hypothetical protein